MGPAVPAKKPRRRNTPGLSLPLLLLAFFSLFIRPARAAGGYPPSLYCAHTSCGAVSVVDATPGGFEEEYHRHVAAGRMLVDYDVRTSDVRGLLISGLWQDNPNGLAWTSLRGVSPHALEAEDTRRARLGFRLIDVEAYRHNGASLAAGIWVRERRPLEGRYQLNVSSAEFYATGVDGWGKEGFIPIDVDMVEGPDATAIRYNHVWVKASGVVSWTIEAAQPWTEYKRMMNNEIDKRYVLTDYEAAEIHNRVWYLAVFLDASEAGIGQGSVQQTTSKGVKGWSYFQNILDSLEDEGYRAVDTTSYSTGGIYDRYDAVYWRRDVPRTRQSSLTARLRNVTTSYWSSTAMQGVGVAVWVDGVPTYLGGSGGSNASTSRDASSKTVFRLCGASQAVGGLLATVLHRKGLVGLDAPAAALIEAGGGPPLPRNHTYTLRDTLAHRSGIRGYLPDDPADPALGPPAVLTRYATAAAALAEAFPAAAALEHAPGTMVAYSTHAYTFAAAAMEGGAQAPVRRLLREHLSDAHGAATLDVEDRALPPQGRRAGSARADRADLRLPRWCRGCGGGFADEQSWKALGGGLEGSAADVARLFDAAINTESIISTAERDVMLKVPQDGLGPYGLGFMQEEVAGKVAYTSSGSALSGTSSGCLLVSTDERTTIAVLMNNEPYQGRVLAREFAIDLATVLWGG